MQYITNSPINHNGKTLGGNVIFTPSTYKFTDIDIEYLLSSGKIKKFVPSDNNIIEEIEEVKEEIQPIKENRTIAKKKKNKKKSNNIKIKLG